VRLEGLDQLKNPITSSGIETATFYRIMIWLVVLYGCQTWSLTLREKRSLGVQRRIFGSKGEGVTRDWRKPRNEKFHNLY
jgi:hypothetical protein